jgi:putative PIN family toxin of toxin-antitoxin system
MRVVFDTNIFISGLKFGGKPAVALQMAAKGVFTLVVSEDILLEIKDVLLRKFRWSENKVVSTLTGISVMVEIVKPDIVLSDCEDPDDNRILEAAITGGAVYIVSGDRHLLQMKMFRGVEIVNVNDFIDRIERAGRSHGL